MVPIPEGSETYSEEPTESDYCTSQESLDQPPEQPGMLTGSGGFPSAADRAGSSAPVKGACELSG